MNASVEQGISKQVAQLSLTNPCKVHKILKQLIDHNHAPFVSNM